MPAPVVLARSLPVPGPAEPVVSPAEHYASLSTRRPGAMVLMFDEYHRALLVRPVYRKEWILPGGTVNAGESPWAAARREVCEELGLDVELGPLACIEYASPRPPATESFEFVFRGPTLCEDDLRSIRLLPGELAAWRLFDYSEAMLSCAPELRACLHAAWPHRDADQPLLLG